MCKPKSGTTNEEIEIALEHVKELQPKIPGLLEVRTGANLNNPDSYGHTYGFIMRFSDEVHLRAYFDTPDPDHEAVGTEFQRICSYMAFDIGRIDCVWCRACTRHRSNKIKPPMFPAAGVRSWN